MTLMNNVCDPMVNSLGNKNRTDRPKKNGQNLTGTLDQFDFANKFFD